MVNGCANTALRQVARVLRDGTLTGLSDRQMLERFIGCRDEAAFEVLVARHGPMVIAASGLPGGWMPITTTSLAWFLCRAPSAGRSLRQGPHHSAQKSAPERLPPFVVELLGGLARQFLE
jgi:hypothetical protein